MFTKYLMLACALLSHNVLAGTFACDVNIQNVLMYHDGSVNVRHSGRNDYTYICNLNNERMGVSVTTCAMWTSVLVNLQAQDKKAAFYYNVPEITSCALLPIYRESPAPVYIGTAN